ncbi:MAG: stage III sporulation protein AE [Oscillospiraceae bacterium]|nr:stage III sporulation protein AE [Oscillospiraceae bacterium]
MKNCVRLIAVIIIAAALTLLCAATALAADAESTAQAQADALELDKLTLPDSARDIIGDMDVMDGLDAERGLAKLWSGIKGAIGGNIGGAMRSAAVIVLIAAVSGTANAAFGGKGGDYATLAGVLAIAAVCLTSVGTFVGMSEQVMDEMSAFSKLLLPTLSAAATASGALTSAAVKYAATVMFLNVMMSVAKSVIMPLIYAYSALSVGEAALGSDALGGAAALIKWLAKTALTVMVVAFVAYISLVGVIAGASDAVAVRAAKVTISTVLPVVGSILADAADTVLSGAAIIKNAVGIFGMLAVTAICAAPFIKLGASYLLFKAAGGLAGALADSRIMKLVNSIGAAFGLALGMAGVAAVMLYISIIAVIRTVTG